ncbi:MAG: S8 family serine peptidase, partial [Saprospiraceae bacterium]|nr:S8 family serine peptidase [Saprospiraceae bacterium]
MYRIIHLASILLFSLICTPSISQSLDHALGEYLVKIEPSTSITEITLELQRFEGEATRIRGERKLKTPWNIWILQFDHTAVHEGRLLNALRQHPKVITAQVNHLVEPRQTFPNDAEFSSQWHWFNDGTNGAVADADVDAELAWDITTGGLTTDGDEIVVAVLDDGTDLTHPDLMDNAWVNQHEIPGNGIDDDENGYIDDYLGWNIFSDDDDVGNGGHGVSVSGMIGAVGNNEIGGTGINWDVKIMMIKNNFATQEALVLEAYAYPYAMRQMYNQTNGEKGAFVVSTNASWGVDFGDPEDAPLWCSFYDDLGAEGILNCGATSNQGINIDIEGDLPTACPSDFMVAVTRSGDANQQGGGFGPMQIDLAAPGILVYTTSSGGGYGSTTGTSFSSPLVAGIIGLMYSAPCSNLTALAKNDPAGAALAVRGYLLDNVTPVAGYEDLVASGGVANAFQAIEDIMLNCGPCPPPSGLDTENLTDVSSDLVWANGPNATSAMMQWRPLGDTIWTDVANAISPVSLAGLMPCTEYEFRVMNECADSMATSDYSFPYVFKTDGCCEAPTELAFSDLTDTTAFADWDFVLAAVNYNIRYRIVGTADWTEAVASGDSLVLTGLSPCNDYEAQVQTLCMNDTTDFGPLVEFHVTGCGACEDLPYCVTEGSTNFEFLQALTINSYTNESGDNGGYALFSSPILLFEPFSTNEIQATIGYQQNSFTENVVAWIDYNQDGEFTEDEIILNDAEVEVVSGNFVIPETALPGLTRMRVKVSFQTNLLGACDSQYEGEVEDYCVIINDGSYDCAAPLNLAAAVQGNAASLSWDNPTNAEAFLIDVSQQGQNDWTSYQTSDNPFPIPPFDDCGDYEVRITTICSGIIGSPSEVLSINIPCPCLAPGTIDSLGSAETEITVGWDGDPLAIGFEVFWKNVDSLTWMSQATTDNSLTFFGLGECTEYDFQIKSVCQNDESGLSDVFTYSTVCPTGIFEPRTAHPIKVWPNPFSGQLTVEFEHNVAEKSLVRILDTGGKQVRSYHSLPLNTGNNKLEFNDLQQLGSRVYIIQVITPSSTTTARVIK